MRRALLALMGACVAVGCDAAGQRLAPEAPASHMRTADALQQDSAYRVMPVPDGGRLTGRVLVHGRVRRDSVLAAMPDTGWCKTSRRVTLVEGAGDRVAGAVVWLQGVHAGKPLPSLRRYELATRRRTR